MPIFLEYKDTVTLVSFTLSTDGYADEVIDTMTAVPALMIHTTGQFHANHRTQIESDAQVYLDPENDFVKNNAYRLEGMAIIANQFGNDDADEWYKITDVVVGEDKLLTNVIDNVNCFLKKTKEVINVS